MPLLSNRFEDTLDVPDIDEDRSWCQQRRTQSSSRYDGEQRATVLGSLSNLQNKFVQANQNEDMSVMTIDSTLQNIQSNHDELSASDMEGSLRRLGAGSTQPFQIEGGEMDKNSRNLSFSSSSCVPNPPKTTDSSFDDELRRNRQDRKQKQRRKYSTQTYSQGGMLYSSLHETTLDDSRSTSGRSWARLNENISIFESSKARGSAKLLVTGTPSTQASSQASSSPRDVTVRGLHSLSVDQEEGYSPSVSSEQFEPEKEIVKLSIELATSKQDLDHSNLQVKRYRNELNKLRVLIEETHKENRRLKYRIADLENKQMADILSHHHEPTISRPELQRRQPNFQTPKKSKYIDESSKSQHGNHFYEGTGDGIFHSQDEVISPIICQERLDQTHLTCEGLYDHSFSTQTDLENEKPLVDESICSNREEDGNIDKKTERSQNNDLEEDPFETYKERDLNLKADTTEDLSGERDRKNKWAIQWNFNSKNTDVTQEDQRKEDKRKARFFFFGTSTSSGIGDKEIEEIRSVSNSVSSNSTAKQEHNKVFGFGFSF